MQKFSLSVSGEQASKHSAYFPYFLIFMLVKYTFLFVLGKCFIYSEQAILIFTEVWLSEGSFLFAVVASD